MALTFDEPMRKVMSEYLVAANRLRHAQDRADPATLRQLAADEEAAEAACAEALLQRGWQSPYALLRRGA